MHYLIWSGANKEPQGIHLGPTSTPMDEADPRHGIEGVSAPTLYIREWYCNRRYYPKCHVLLLTFATCSEYTSVLFHHKQYLEQPELEPSQLKMSSLICFHMVLDLLSY